MNAPNATPEDIERKRRIRRNVVFLVLLALAFYVGFIVLTLTRT